MPKPDKADAIVNDLMDALGIDGSEHKRRDAAQRIRALVNTTLVFSGNPRPEDGAAMPPSETLARWCDEVEEDHRMAEASCVECLSVWPCSAIQGARAVRAVLTWYTGPGDGRELLADAAKALEAEP